MKRYAALLVSLLLALTIGAAAAETSCAGTWTLTRMTVAGMSIAADALDAALTLVLNEDGSCTLTANDRSENGSWTLSETGVCVTDAAGVANVLAWADNTLTYTQGDASLTFTPTATPVTIRTGLSVADFNGRWELHHLQIAQSIILQENMGVDMTITLQDGQGLTVMETGEEAKYACECETREISQLGTALYCFFLDPETNARTGSGLALLLFSDGQLVWLDSDSTGNYYYYFQMAQPQ
ncbi:MAG: hypothetical protein IJ343_13500 [Clostridia bacterium]|nr:hypothetical protein [Clostridia bacterium]